MKRQLHPPTSWHLQSIGGDQWEAIERAGCVSLSQKHRQAIQSAYVHFQTCREGDRASASSSDVKGLLGDLSKRLQAARAALQPLLSRQPLQRAVLYELRKTVALADQSGPDLSEIKHLCLGLQRIALAASKTEEKLHPTGRGRTSKHWVDDFLSAVDDVYREAGGTKKPKQAFLQAVRDAIGYRGSATDDTEKRRPDKARRRRGRTS